MSIFPFMGIYKYESSRIREYYDSTHGLGLHGMLVIEIALISLMMSKSKRV
jgi:hypothetical protein